jgi:uncharacterized membrane protein HdeD (DUF308 family)
MELKYYDKPWLPAFKGVFLILFGIIAMLRILGSVKSLAVLFVVLIAIIGILLIATGIRYKKSMFRGWTIASGAINLVLCLILGLNIESSGNIETTRNTMLGIILIWVIFYAVSEIVEAGLLISLKNAFSVLFILNALLTSLFGYSLYVLMSEYTLQRVFFVGLIALVFGLVNMISSYLLSIIKENK